MCGQRRACTPACLYGSATGMRDASVAMDAKHLLWGAVLLGTAAGYVWSASPPPVPGDGSVVETSPAAPTASPQETENTAYYPNCDAARATGNAPIFAGQPGYRSELDADGDGRACEPYRGG